MAAGLAAKSTAAAATTTHRAANVGRGDPTAPATARGRVAGHPDIVQGQVAEVDNTAAHCRRAVDTRRCAIPRRQALGDDQAIQRRRHTAAHPQHLSLVLPAEGHIRHTVVVQITGDGDVFADDQLRVEVNRHGGTERDGIAGHRIAQSLAQ